MTDKINLVGEGPKGHNVTITLETEPAKRIAGYLIGNRVCTSCMSTLPPFGCECESPTPPNYVKLSEEGSKRGRSLLIVGAGPSLEANAPAAFATHSGDVWCANSALNWCVEHGYRATHGIAIDASHRMFDQVWTDPPDVTYYLATTVNPGLTGRILGAGREVIQFHSARGAPDEFTLYPLLYPLMFIAGRGLNVVNRAVEMALWMGYAKIKLLGVDHAYAGDQMYADGRGAREGDVFCRGTIDGREWVTNPDMLYCAVELVRMRHEFGRSRVSFVGDVLPKALQDKSPSFLKRCIDWEPRVA